MLRVNTKIDCYPSLRLDEKGQHHRPASKRRNLEYTTTYSPSFQSFKHMNSPLPAYLLDSPLSRPRPIGKVGLCVVSSSRFTHTRRASPPRCNRGYSNLDLTSSCLYRTACRVPLPDRSSLPGETVVRLRHLCLHRIPALPLLRPMSRTSSNTSQSCLNHEKWRIEQQAPRSFLRRIACLADTANGLCLRIFRTAIRQRQSYARCRT